MNISTKFRILILSIVCFVMSASMHAQSSLTVDASQLMAGFKFVNSKGEEDKSYSSIVTGAYSFGYRIETEKGLLIHPRLGMRRGGGTMVYDDANYSWNLQYADVKVGVGYMYKGSRFSPYLLVSPYYAYLLRATQTLNNIDYDVKTAKALKNTDFGVFISPGLKVTASESVSAYVEFSYMMGLQNIETNTNGQEGFNKAYAVTLGVAFSMAKK